MKNGREIVSKRIDPLRIRYPEEELDVARRVKNSIDNISCDWAEFSAQRFIGLIFDHGNFYLLSLKEAGRDANELINEKLTKELKLGIEILEHRLTGYNIDLNPRNIIVSKNSATQKHNFVVIDFETQFYHDINLTEGSVNKLAGQTSAALKSEYNAIRHINSAA